MKKVLFFKTRRNDHDVSQIVLLLLVLPAVMRAQNTLGCPDLIQTNKCSCYTLEDGLFLDCQDTDPKDIKNALKSVSDIHSLSVYNLDDNEESLGPHFIPQGVCIKHIHMSRTSIKDIGDDMFMPLRRCLETLSIVSSKIKTIPQKALSGLLKLMSIDFTSNYIEEIPSYSFYGLPLMKLDVKGNVIHDISESAFSSLELTLSEINLSENNLTTFPIEAFAKLRHLRSLRLSWNEMSSFPIIVRLNNLKTLSLKNNSLKAVDLLSINVPGLKHLTLSFNVLDYLPLEAFTQLPLLEVLYMEHCNIEHIFEGTFKHNKNILRLNLAQNIISTIPSTLFELQNSVAEFNISNNFLDYVPYNNFQNLTSVESVDLTDNLIPRVELSGFEKLTKLKYLILKKNEIKSLTASKKVEFQDLMLFDISYNKLENLPLFVFDLFPNIQNINISHNDIIRFDFLLTYKKFGISLINIDLSKNPVIAWSSPRKLDNNTLIANLYELHICATNMTNIDDITFELFTSLQHLYLKFNQIRRLSVSPFSKLIFLENLDLSYNRISQLKTSNFRGLTKLRTLCLSNNNIESMESFAEELSNLKLLDLAHNKLQNILNEDLINLKELTVLYLSHNNIKYISVTAFRSLNKIIQIDLDHNKLQSIPIELLTSVENHIQEISIKGNVILCSCKKDNAWVWIQDHPKIMKSNAVICYNDEYPQEKCDVPVISQLSVDKHKDNSVSVSWFIRNRTAIKALQILYYGEDGNNDVKSKYLEKSDVSVHIRDLEPNFNYTVCVIALSEDPVDYEDEIVSEVNNTIDDSSNSTARITQDMAAAILIRSSSNECVLFNTFRKPSVVKTKPIKKFAISSLLNRRMGLIVGCSLGFVVFFIMVSVLLYTKIKERKRIAKSDPAWSEMNDYHSMASKDDILQNSITASTDNILLGMAKNRKQSIDHLN
ncbi:unnamed protein product [Arctia plantaginis]|uniref:Fibronectin type-III domain-containing protein n=1 Tax=Arctia plantaginis TaxID=874455 RepID=A0A8S0ZZY4_ARCPL|nr:unnamed protein product [Arctia plantaginis]